MEEVIWNFSESGYGKSSADGIGGSVLLRDVQMKELLMEQT